MKKVMAFVLLVGAIFAAHILIPVASSQEEETGKTIYIVGKGKDIAYDQSLYFVDENGNEHPLGIQTWGGHFTVSPSCNYVLYSTANGEAGNTLELLNLVTGESEFSYAWPDLGGYIFPAMFTDNLYATIVVENGSRKILVTSQGEWNTIVFERETSYYLSGMKWVNQTTLLVKTSLGHGQGGLVGYVQIDIPTGVEKVITQDEYDAVTSNVTDITDEYNQPDAVQVIKCQN